MITTPMFQLKAVDMFVDRKFAVNFRAVDIHFQGHILMFFVDVSTEPDSGCGAIAKLPDRPVAVVEYLLDLTG